tara:strand:- start:227 stop:5431 length:5205 start_codon:yes stop_codon:yes gene_type:complete
MMADPGEGGGGGGGDDGGGGGGGDTSPARLILNGVDCGVIVEIGNVGDYFPNGATTIPASEYGEIYNPGPQWWTNPNYKQLVKKCFEYPGYLISTKEINSNPVSYESSLFNPFQSAGVDWGAASQETWNANTDIDFSSGTPFSTHKAGIFLNPRYWTSRLQALFQHNREQGLRQYLSANKFSTAINALISFNPVDSEGDVGDFTPQKRFEIVDSNLPVVVTSFPLYDWKNESEIQTDFKMYWVCQTWKHIDPGPGLDGRPRNDFRLVTKSGTPIEFETFPNSTFGDSEPGQVEYTDLNNNFYEGTNTWELYENALPYGLPYPIMPFRKTPFSVSFDDCITDGPDVSVTQNQGSSIIVSGQSRTIKSQNTQFLNDWNFTDLAINTQNIPLDIVYIAEYEMVDNEILPTGLTIERQNGNWVGSLQVLTFGKKYLFELAGAFIVPEVYPPAQTPQYYVDNIDEFPTYYEEFDVVVESSEIIDILDVIEWVNLGRGDIADFIQPMIQEGTTNELPRAELAGTNVPGTTPDIQDFEWLVIPPEPIPPNPFPFDETLGFRIPRIFPFIKQHNLDNSTQGFPNLGFHPGDLPNLQMIEAHNLSEQSMVDEYGDYPLFESTEGWPNLPSFPYLTHQKGVVRFQEWQQRWKEIGISNTSLTVNQFFIQDYDFAGVYTYDEKGLPTNHNTTTFQQNLDALDNAINNPSINILKKQQALIMRARYVLTGVPGEAWGSHLGPLSSVKFTGDTYVQYVNPLLNEDTSLQIFPEDTFSPLGPPAPTGYVPVVGSNVLQYFVPEPDGNPNIDFEEPAAEGHYPFYFSNGIDINKVDDDTTLGFSNGIIIQNYKNYLETQGIDINNYSLSQLGNLFSISQQYVDRIFWRWAYDTYNYAYNSLTTFSDNSNGNSEPDPDDFIPSDMAPNIINKLLQPAGLAEILADPGNTLDAQKIQNIITLYDIVNGYNALYEQQLSSEGSNGFSHPLQLFAPITGEWSQVYGATTEQVSLNLKLNPHINSHWDIFVDKGWSDWVKLAISTLPSIQGGLQLNEYNSFIWYLYLQGTTFVPNNIYQGTPAGETLPPPETTDIEFGVFYQPMGQTLSPGVNTIIYYGPDFSNLSSWEECEYLNQNFDSFNGQIESVRFGVTSALIYTGETIILPDGSQLDGGFYPTDTGQLGETYNDLAALELETVLKTGQTIQVYVRPEQPEFQTTAFGSQISQYGNNIFNSGTTLYTMIQTLLSDGYNGQTIDVNSDGSITLADGESIATAFNDYRPYQMILFAQQINMMHVVYQNFPPEGYIVNPLLPDEMQEYDLPPIPDIFVEAAGSVKSFDAIQVFENSRTRGYFKGNPGFNEIDATTFINATDGTSTIPNSQGSNVIQNEIGSRFLTGNQIFTQSLNSSNDPYSFVIMDGNPISASSEPVFSVSFGHIEGSGSLVKSKNKSAAFAVYKQWANTLLGTSEGEFFTISGSLRGSNESPTDNVNSQEPVDVVRPDRFIYVLSSLKRGDTFLNNEDRPNWKITLSGSDASGNGVQKSFVSDYEFNPGGTIQSNGLTRYNIVEGTNSKNKASITPPSKEVVGHFYPEMGVWIFNEILVKTFSGQDSTAVVSFNTTTTGDNGLAMNGHSKDDKEYNNALKFINTLKNNGSSKCIEDLEYQNDERLIFCITKIKRGEFNYSTNASRNTNDGVIKSFNSSMDYDEEGETSPTTFANSIQIYDSNGYMVAVGKLSTPIKKDYNSEVVIKVVIPT